MCRCIQLNRSNRRPPANRRGCRLFTDSSSPSSFSFSLSSSSAVQSTLWAAAKRPACAAPDGTPAASSRRRRKTPSSKTYATPRATATTPVSSSTTAVPTIAKHAEVTDVFVSHLRPSYARHDRCIKTRRRISSSAVFSFPKRWKKKRAVSSFQIPRSPFIHSALCRKTKEDEKGLAWFSNEKRIGFFLIFLFLFPFCLSRLRGMRFSFSFFLFSLPFSLLNESQRYILLFEPCFISINHLTFLFQLDGHIPPPSVL